MGVMSGTLDLVQRHYAGTRIRDGILWSRLSRSYGASK